MTHAVTCDVCHQQPIGIDGVCATCWQTLAHLDDGTVASAEATTLRALRAERAHGMLATGRRSISIPAPATARR